MLEGMSQPLDFGAMAQVPVDTFTIFNGIEETAQLNLQNYIAYYDGVFFVIWSLGLLDEGQSGQRVYYSTSVDGETWATASPLTAAPPSGWRYTSRGLWKRNGMLYALYALDEEGSGFGNGLELRASVWNGSEWVDDQLIADNTINNFEPIMLPDGNWAFGRRDSNFDASFVKGDIDDWTIYPIANTADFNLDEPVLTLVGGTLVCTYRANDSAEDNRLVRAFSFDLGETWTEATKTNFPDSRSKHHILRLSTGRYALCSNARYNLNRDKLTIALSDDGMRFDDVRMLRGEATTPQWSMSEARAGYQYPHAIEVDGNLYIVYSRNKEDIQISRVAISAL